MKSLGLTARNLRRKSLLTIENNLEIVDESCDTSIYNFDFFGILYGFIIRRGLKIKAYKIVELMLRKLSSRFRITRRHLLILLVLAIEDLKPMLNLRIVKHSGLSYKLPVLLSDRAASVLVVKWIFKNAKLRSVKRGGFVNKLVLEFVDIIEHRSVLYRRKAEIYKVAVASRAVLSNLTKLKVARTVGGQNLYTILHSNRDRYDDIASELAYPFSFSELNLNFGSEEFDFNKIDNIKI